MLVPSLRDLLELDEAISIRVLAYTNKVACYYVGLAVVMSIVYLITISGHSS